MLIKNTDIQKRLAAHQKSYSKAMEAYQTDIGSNAPADPTPNHGSLSHILATIGHVGGVVGDALFHNTGKLINETGELGAKTANLASAVTAAATHNKKAEANALKAGSKDKFTGKGQGLFGAGGFATNDQLNKMSGKDFAKTIVAGGVGTATEIAPWLIGAGEANAAVKAGQVITKGEKVAKAAKAIGAGAGISGVGSTANQILDTGHVDWKKVAEDTGLGGVMGGLGYAGGKVVKGIKSAKAAKAAEAATVRENNTVMHGVNDVVDNMNAQDAFKGAQAADAAGRVPENMRLGNGEQTIRNALNELDTKLNDIRQGKVNNTTMHDAATLDGAPQDTQLTGGKLKKNGELDMRVNSSKTAGTFTPKEQMADSSTRAKELKSMLEQRAQLQHQLDTITNPAPEGNIGEVMSSMADHPSSPRDISNIPEAQIVPPKDTPTAPTAAAPTGTVADKVAATADGTTTNVTRAERATAAAAPVPTENKFALPKAQTKLNKAVQFVKSAATSESGKLSQLGAGGKAIAKGLSDMRNNSEVAQAAFMKQIPTVLKLSKDEYKQFVDSLDTLARGGEHPNVSPNVQKAMAEWQRIIPTIRQAAVKAGISVGDLGDTYYPHNYTKLLSTESGMQKAIRHLVQTKQADNVVEAAGMLRHMKDRYATPFGHFDNSRKVDLPGFDNTKDALVSYVQGAFNKVAHAEQFGANGEKAAEMLDHIKQTKGELAQVDALKSYLISSGQYKWDRSDAYLKTTSAIRSFNRVRSLGLSSLMNAGQTTNTASVAGIWRTAKAAMKQLSPKEREYIHETGVIVDSVLNNLREQSGVGNKLLGKLTAPGFNKVEDFNRSVAAEAGRSYANKLAKKAFKGNARAEKALRDKLGVTGDIVGGRLSKEQQIQASRKMVETTQFKVDAQDLPGWASSPEGKMVSQFRTFSYKQTGFVYNQLVTEAFAHGNFAPLARFLAVGVPLGYATSSARDWIKGKNSNDISGVTQKTSASSHILGALQNVGAFGMLSDVGFLGSNIKSQRFPQYLASSLAGPTAGFALETASNVSAAANGNPQALERQGLKMAPVIGARASNNLVPYKSGLSDKQTAYIESTPTPEHQAYYDFFTQMSQSNKKTDTSKQVKEAIKNQQYTRARRLTDQHNAAVDQQVEALKKRAGDLSPDMRKYIQTNYKVSYDYYYKNQKKIREGKI